MSDLVNLQDSRFTRKMRRGISLTRLLMKVKANLARKKLFSTLLASAAGGKLCDFPVSGITRNPGSALRNWSPNLGRISEMPV